MRDKERIHRILCKIELIWNAMPDQRFGQLMENLRRFYWLFPYDKVQLENVPFMWGQEDDETEEKLDKIIKELEL
jgi:hypothetical protein